MVRLSVTRVSMAACAAAFGFLFSVAWTSHAEDTKPAPKKEAAEEKPADPFALPKDTTPASLLKFINKTKKYPAKTEDELSAMLAAIEKAADLVLASKEADEDEAVSAVRYKFMVFNTRTQYLQDEKAAKKGAEFAKSLESDKRPAVKEIAEVELLKSRVNGMEELEGDARKELIDQVFTYIEKGTLSRTTAQFAMSFAETVETVGKPKEASEVYARVAKLFSKSKDEEIAAMAKKFEGVSRRLNLPGNFLEVEGVTNTGKPFDWKSYRGKVVLVDFWATWCGPCIRELPNVLENYEKYHDKGFEVVGISLDDDEDALKEFVKAKKIPWTTLFGKDEATRGWEHPMAAKYGIMGIPTVILVDKEGKVVDLEARGEKLGVLLEKLLGDGKAEKKAEKTGEK